MPSIKKTECEESVCVKLCNVMPQKTVPKPAIEPKPKPKLKSKPKPKPKLKSKPQPKPKPIVKQVEVVKEEPVVIPEVIQEIVEEVKEEPQEEIVVAAPIEKVEEKVVEQEIVEEVFVEDSQTKQVRLEKEYMQEHIAKIMKLLEENLYYPRRARKRGVVGEIMVKFTLSTQAQAHSIEVISSNSEILSRAAIKTIEDLSGEFPKPEEELILHVPINYALK